MEAPPGCFVVTDRMPQRRVNALMDYNRSRGLLNADFTKPMTSQDWARARSYIANHKHGPHGWQWIEGGEAAHRAKFPKINGANTTEQDR